MKTLYTAHAISVAGRGGTVETDDRKISFQLGRPGSNDPGTNPEQLFACGYGACFGGAVEAVAKKQGIDIGKVMIEASVSLNQDDLGGFFLKAELNAVLPGLDDEIAASITRAAHQMCPYSKATRNNIDVVLKANGNAVAA